MNLHKYLFSTSPISLFFYSSFLPSLLQWFFILRDCEQWFPVFLSALYIIYYVSTLWLKDLRTSPIFYRYVTVMLLRHNVFQCWRKYNNCLKIFERRRIFYYFNYYLLIYLIFFRIYLLVMLVFFDKKTSKVHSPNLQLLRWYNNRST